MNVPIYKHSTENIFLFRFFKYFDDVRRNISESCRESYDYFRQHSQEEWALKMIDANSVVESGLVNGNLQFFGAFDECIELKMEIRENRTTKMNGAIQYCTVQFPISILMNKNESAQYPAYLLLMVPPTAGICLPAACSAQRDLPLILNQLSLDDRKLLRISKCVTKSDLDIRNRIETIHIIIMLIFFLIISMIIIGSIVEQLKKIENSNSLLLKLFLCFGLERNLGYLFNISRETRMKNLNEPVVKCHKPVPQIDCLHGIRVLSFLFILIYHIFTEAQVPSANIMEIVGAEHGFLYQLITNATMWVDTFFLLSGFLMTHCCLYQYSTSPNKTTTRSSLWDSLSKHPKRILHRYVRLTPSVAGIVSISILIELFGSGPLWNNYVQLSHDTCHKNWWNLFLYVNNFCNLNSATNPQSECLPYLWYLAVDMQLFIISPFLTMFLVHQSKRMQTIGIMLNVGVILFSWILTAILMAWKHLTPTVLVTVYDLEYINSIYKASYCRISPYCVGVLLAYFLRQHQFQRQQEYLVDLEDGQHVDKRGNWKTGLMLLMISISLMLATTLLTYPWLQGADYRNMPSILYGTVHRTVWAFAWAIFIWAAARRHLFAMNRIFSAGVLQLFSKLTYQSYLLHSILIAAVINSVRQKIYFSQINFTLDVVRYFFLTQLISIITFVMFERPFINIEMAFMQLTKKNKTFCPTERQQTES